MQLLAQLGVVAVGGAIGAAVRYATSVGCAACGVALAGKVPVATLVVNVVGCLIGGVLVAGALAKVGPDHTLRLLLITGLLGGLTTFSAFGVETLDLLRQGQVGWAILNVGANVGLALAAVGVGMALGGGLSRGPA